MSLLSAFSGWGWIDIISVFLVFVGIVGEAWSFFMKTPFNPSGFHALESKKKIIEKWSLIILAAGIALEIPATTENLKDAAEARLETKKLEQQIEHANRIRIGDLSFATNLLTIPDIMVDLRCEDDDDARLTMLNLSYAFSMGGWRLTKFEVLTNMPRSSSFVGRMPFGIGIDFPKKSAFPNDKAEQAAKLLYSELSKSNGVSWLVENEDFLGGGS
jgi:hypothetical protein